jgi:hypothetical protein
MVPTGTWSGLWRLQIQVTMTAIIPLGQRLAPAPPDRGQGTRHFAAFPGPGNHNEDRVFSLLSGAEWDEEDPQ